MVVYLLGERSKNLSLTTAYSLTTVLSFSYKNEQNIASHNKHHIKHGWLVNPACQACLIICGAVFVGFGGKRAAWWFHPSENVFMTLCLISNLIVWVQCHTSNQFDKRA